MQIVSHHLLETNWGSNPISHHQSHCSGYLVMYLVDVKFWQPPPVKLYWISCHVFGGCQILRATNSQTVLDILSCVGVKILTATTSHTVLDILSGILWVSNSDSHYQPNCTGYLVTYFVRGKFWQPLPGKLYWISCHVCYRRENSASHPQCTGYLVMYFVGVKILTATTSHTVVGILSCIWWMSNSDSHRRSHCSGYRVMYLVDVKFW